LDWFSFYDENFFSFVPLLALIPYIFFKRNFLFIKLFWLGLLIGFVPFLFWTFSINPYLDKNIIYYLFEKFNFLSSKNTFTNPFYYYFWNVPVTFLPWSFFAIIGTIYNISQSKDNKVKNFSKTKNKEKSPDPLSPFAILKSIKIKK